MSTGTETIKPWSGELNWTGDLFQSQSQWIETLDYDEISELQIAVDSITGNKLELSAVTRNDVALQKLGRRLESIEKTILSGRGFSLIRGLPAKNWSDEQLIVAYWIMGLWLGDAVSQNAEGHLLGHVIDNRTDKVGTRIYQTNRAQPFHSDSCDVVGLLCLRTAKSGGASAVASSAAIHNHMLREQPDDLSTLYEEFQCDRYGEIPAGKRASYPVRIYNAIDAQLVCCGMDPDIRSAQRLDEVPPMSGQQLQALDTFQHTARRLALNMNLARGDIQLANNHVIVHARTAFEDHEDRDRRRHLVRLWLSSDKGRSLPGFLRERWGNIECGTVRGGIRVPGATTTVKLSPD